MENKRYVEELARLLNGEPWCIDIFKTIPGEKIMEHAALQILSQLIEIKNARHAGVGSVDDGKIQHHLSQIRELLSRKDRISKNELSLLPPLVKYFMEGDAVDTGCVREVIISNAEEWIYIAKQASEIVHAKTHGFAADKAAWYELHKRLAAFRDFCYTEEYKFLSRCLEINGNIILKITLERALNSERLYKLSSLFVEFYGDLDCHLGNTVDDCDAYVANMHALLSQLRKACRLPRILKRTVYRLLNLLRIDILRYFCGKPHRRQHELFLAFDSLVGELPADNASTNLKYSTIIVEDLNILAAYLWDAEQMSVGMCLIEAAKKTSRPEIVTEVENSLKVYVEQYIMKVENELNEGKPPAACGPENTASQQEPITATVAFTNLISDAAVYFNSHAECLGELDSLENKAVEALLNALLAKTLEYREFFRYEAFLAKTKDVRTRYLTYISGLFMRSIKNEHPGDMLLLMRMIVPIGQIISHYEDSIMVGSIRSMLSKAKTRIGNYINSLSYDIPNMHVLSLMGGAPKMLDGDSTSAKLILADRVEFSDTELVELGDVFSQIDTASKINAYFNTQHIERMAAEKAWVEPLYRRIERIFGLYRGILEKDRLLFRTPQIEAFMNKLVNLKWKHINSMVDREEYETLDQAIKILEVKEFTHGSILQNFMAVELPSIYLDGKPFIPDALLYKGYFEGIGFSEEVIVEWLNTCMPTVAMRYIELMIENLRRAAMDDRFASRYTFVHVFDWTTFCGLCDGSLNAGLRGQFIERLAPLIPRLANRDSILDARINDLRGVFDEKWSEFYDNCFHVRDAQRKDELTEEYTKASNMLLAYANILKLEHPLFSISLEFAPLDLISEKGKALRMLLSFFDETVESLPSAEVISEGNSACALEFERKVVHDYVVGKIMFILGHINRIFDAESRICQAVGYALHGVYSSNLAPKNSEQHLGINFASVMDNEEPYMEDGALMELSHCCRETDGLLREYYDKINKIRTSHMGAVLSAIPHRDLTKDEINQRGESVACEVASFIGRYAMFEVREDGYPAQLAELMADYGLLKENVKRTNILLSQYGAALIGINLTTNPVEEIELYREVSARLNSILGLPLCDYDECEFKKMQSMLTHGTTLIILAKLFDRVDNYKLPLSYITTIKEQPTYFDLKISIGEYLCAFDECKIKHLLKKGKSAAAIQEYINTREGPVLSRSILSAAGLVLNLDDLRERLHAEWARHDVAYKFNIYGLYAAEMEEARSRLTHEERILDLFYELQPEISELAKLFAGKALSSQSPEYRALSVRYACQTKQAKDAAGSDILREQIATELIAIQGELITLKNSLHATLETYKSEAPRLYFVTNEDMIRMLNEPEQIKAVLPQVFNVDGFMGDTGVISGIRSGDEIVLFDEAIVLSERVDEVVRSVEMCITNHLDGCFERRQHGNVAIMDELLTLYEHFNGNPLCTNYTSGVLEKIAEKQPDVLRAYPIPRIINGKLYAGNILYGFEYYPPTQFIFTALTSKVFASIYLNAKRSGLILYGPSGTGKTETVRHFCRTVGKPLYTFCCSERVEYSTIRNIIVGCARLSSYLCFDEFNRLRKEVMSSAADCILEHRERIKIFLTMNIGYQGRFEIPKTLKEILGEVHVELPDIADISRFHTGDDKLYELISALSEQCSSASHYDFRLRAINMIVAGATSEKQIVENLIDFYVASLTPADRIIFSKLVHRIYGKVVDLSSDNYTSAGLLIRALTTKTGILVCGERGAGVCQEAMGSVHAKVYTYNPSNILLVSSGIFGSFSRHTGEWQDSKFLRDLRNARGESIFVFDGPLSSEWVEDFNSVLDDNRTVCLLTGERISVPREFKFIFICQSLDAVTPATLTRVFLLFVTEKITPATVEYSPESIAEANMAGRVVFVAGRRGTGRQRLFGSSRLFFSDDPAAAESIIRSTDQRANETVYMDGFNNATPAMKEVIREFYAFGTIASRPYRNLRIVCGIDTNGDNPFESMYYVSSSAPIHLVRVPNINYLDEVGAYISDAKLQSLLVWIHEKYEFSLQDLNKFKHLVQNVKLAPQVSQDICSQVYFIFRLLHGSDQAVERYIENTCPGPFDPCLLFNPSTLLIEPCDVDWNISRVCCLVYCGLNVIVRGPRLSGKGWLVENALDALNSPEISGRTKIHHWADSHDPCEVLQSDGPHIFIVTESPGRYLEETAVEIILPDKTYEFDCVQYLSRNYGEANAEHGAGVEHTDGHGRCSLDKKVFLDIHTPYRHPSSCQHSTVKFNNMYKYLDFIHIFKKVIKEFEDEWEAKRAFLLHGIARIDEFRTEAVVLTADITKKSLVLAEGVQVTSKLIRKLEKEKTLIEEEERRVSIKKQELEKEMRTSSAKKDLVDAKLQAIAPVLMVSQEAISKITKAHLSEIKVMSSPPVIIKETIENVHFLLEGRRTSEWKDLLLYLKRDDFIAKVMNHKDHMGALGSRLEAMSTAQMIGDFTAERADKASKACGALFRWVRACREYHRVSLEIEPLRTEIEAIESKICVQMDKLLREEQKLKELKQKLCAHEERHAASLIELKALKEEIGLIQDKADLLNKVVACLEDEACEWRSIEYKCPIAYMESGAFVFKYHRSLFWREGHVPIPADSHKDAIDVSVNDRGYTDMLDNALNYEKSIVLRDVNKFDNAVYRFIKRHMKLSLEGDCAFSAVLVSPFSNVYEQEVYEVAPAHTFASFPESKLEETKQHLLELLTGDPGLIIEQKTKLDQERLIAEKARAAVEYSSVLSNYYGELSKQFSDVYHVELSLDVYREVIHQYESTNRADRYAQDMGALESHIRGFFAEAFCGVVNAFELGEVLKYVFDYTFYTSYNELIFKLKTIIEFDEEISAGAPECNRKIAELLEEDANKLVLVKNMHFLPPLKKTGTNRFIFIIEAAETHPLMRDTRIVFYDRNNAYEAVCKGLLGVFHAQSNMLRFHALILSLGFNFPLGDLETALANDQICDDYLVDVIYMNRIPGDRRLQIMTEWQRLKQ